MTTRRGVWWHGPSLCRMAAATSGVDATLRTCLGATDTHDLIGQAGSHVSPLPVREALDRRALAAARGQVLAETAR